MLGTNSVLISFYPLIKKCLLSCLNLGVSIMTASRVINNTLPADTSVCSKYPHVFIEICFITSFLQEIPGNMEYIHLGLGLCKCLMPPL